MLYNVSHSVPIPTNKIITGPSQHTTALYLYSAIDIEYHIYFPAFKFIMFIFTADSWPQRFDDTNAIKDWGWKHEYDISKLTKIMLANINRNRQQLKSQTAQ